MSPTYEFVHPLDEIVSIELLYNGNAHGSGTDESKFRLIKCLSEDEIVQFMNEVYPLETSYCINPPPRGDGYYIARVTYSNGNVEILGAKNIVFIEGGTESNGVGEYYFTDDSLDAVIHKYADKPESIGRDKLWNLSIPWFPKKLKPIQKPSQLSTRH